MSGRLLSIKSGSTARLKVYGWRCTMLDTVWVLKMKSIVQKKAKLNLRLGGLSKWIRNTLMVRTSRLHYIMGWRAKSKLLIDKDKNNMKQGVEN